MKKRSLALCSSARPCAWFLLQVCLKGNKTSCKIKPTLTTCSDAVCFLKSRQSKVCCLNSGLIKSHKRWTWHSEDTSKKTHGRVILAKFETWFTCYYVWHFIILPWCIFCFFTELTSLIFFSPKGVLNFSPFSRPLHQQPHHCLAVDALCEWGKIILEQHSVPLYNLRNVAAVIASAECRKKSLFAPQNWMNEPKSSVQTVPGSYVWVRNHFHCGQDDE